MICEFMGRWAGRVDVRDVRGVLQQYRTVHSTEVSEVRTSQDKTIKVE